MEMLMGMKNTAGIRKETRGGKPHWVIDFRYTSRAGKRVRFRRDAAVQLQAAAATEARRLMARAAETGSVEDEAARPDDTSVPPTFGTFTSGLFELQFMPSFRPATATRYRALLRQSVTAFFGEKVLREIGPSDIRAFAATLQQRGVQTKGAVTLVRTILRAAHESGQLDELPVFPRGLAKVSRKLPDAPSPAEFEVMLTASGWLGLAVMLSGLAGMRMGEALALEVRDLDFEGHRILLRRALSEGISLTPKSGHERVVPLVPELEERLREAVRRKLPKARVVLDDSGETPRRQAVLATFKKFLKASGLKERSFHSLRHYFVTELVRRGAGLEAVRTLAGHSTLAMTQRYAHATGDDLKEAIGKLGK
jgi:integrase